MSALTYYIQHMPDDAFWQKLSQLPLQSGHYPEVLTLAGNIAATGKVFTAPNPPDIEAGATAGLAKLAVAVIAGAACKFTPNVIVGPACTLACAANCFSWRCMNQSAAFSAADIA